MYKTQERKLKEYINQHGNSHSPGFTPPTSQPTLNAINNMAPLSYMTDGLGMAGAMKPPDSPMSAASSTEPSEVSILDSCEGSMHFLRNDLYTEQKIALFVLFYINGRLSVCPC